jgi:hypothetical protein
MAKKADSPKTTIKPLININEKTMTTTEEKTSTQEQQQQQQGKTQAVMEWLLGMFL